MGLRSLHTRRSSPKSQKVYPLPVQLRVNRLARHLPDVPTVPHLDMPPVYAELPIESLTVNFYDTHPNEFAHELAAREIADFLERRISLESP
jgi:hypothetical protein